MPIRCRKIIEDNWQELSKIACQIYIDDDEYYFLGINGVGMLPIQTESLELEHKHIVSCDWFLSCVIKCRRTLFKGFCGFDVFIWVHLNSSIYAEMV